MHKVLCFGEILWDFLPAGLFLGGAPFNVACHLARHQVKAFMWSAVGRDTLGEEALKRAKWFDVDTTYVCTVPDLPTGYVQVKLSDTGDARYTITQPVAWDSIAADNSHFPDFPVDAVVFGSLALRSESNQKALRAYLEKFGKEAFVVIDVNLRPPFDDLDLVNRWIPHTDLVKVNEEEAERLLGRTVKPEDLGLTLAEKFQKNICLTRAADGTEVVIDGTRIAVPGERVKVKSTVGAGDAFLARLLVEWLSSAGNITAKELRNAVRLAGFVTASDGAVPPYAANDFDAGDLPFNAASGD